ncbi:hypothetical protein CY0110_17337 [Crocosphaera chwakensis CCY0110]|uniref:Uncharacterized protein n=1 Tax=Crocosphaera chwakensis CCY0110 TaxID=391612 RepID=A3IIE9_9CHRO|nr:hypothetical protein CY0110_17337 [Crocosphaera chwakensis CCY0110]
MSLTTPNFLPPSRVMTCVLINSLRSRMLSVVIVS